MRNLLILIMSVSMVVSGCALAPKTKNGKKRMGITFGAMAVGAGVGTLSAPDDEKKEAHAVAWLAIFGLIAKFIVDWIWGDHHELYEKTKEHDDYRSQNDFMKIDEKLGYMNEVKNGKKVKVIYEIHKGKKIFPVSPTEKYISDQLIKVRPLTDEEKVKYKNK